MDSSNPTFAGLPLLAWIPLLPLIGALINLTLGRHYSKRTAHVIACGVVLVACVLSGFLVFGTLFSLFKAGGNPVHGVSIEQTVYTWIEVGSFKTQLAFRLDTLSAVMIMIITFVGFWIHVYSTGYMHNEKGAGYARYFGYLNLFMGAMLILVLAANLPVMFIGWEGVGLCSFLLIGFWFENDAYATAGRKAFVVNRIGDFAFLLGMFLLYWAVKGVNVDDMVAAGTAKLQGLTPEAATSVKAELLTVIQGRGSLDFANLANPAMGPAYMSPFWGSERLAAAAGILLFIGACGKSAQLPLYVWLPDAMAGPTPVSALIHAATMVTAGVYMVVRLSFMYSCSTTALAVIAVVGLLTALAAAFMAFAQTDLKKVLAYSTVSQLGFMFVAVGTGNWVAAIFHLGTHAFFKACLFLGAGSVMHGMEHGGSTTPGDITTMGGLRKHMPITRITFAISCLAIAGIFPFAGFWSKDEILAGAWAVHPPGWPDSFGKILWGGLLLAALGTAFYMWRLYFLVFSGDERSDAAKKAHESPISMTSALVILAFFATIGGFIGLPHLHDMHLPSFTHGLAAWLDPAVSHSWQNPGVPYGTLEIHGETADTTTFVLMGLALSIGALGIGIAWMFYGRGPSPSLGKLVDQGPLEPLYEASRNKLWVDEIYDTIFVRPFRALARGLYEIVDRFIIDTVAVNGTAFVVGLAGRVSRWAQNGQIQRYLAGLVIGAAAMFLITDCHQHPTFGYELHGDELVLHAEPGAGVIGATSTVHWDIDGDGKPDHDINGGLIEGTDIKTRWGNNEGGSVTMFVEDPISQKTEKYTQVIREESK
jgi:NADH-quinone oxidoreductase subunit L